GMRLRIYGYVSGIVSDRPGCASACVGKRGDEDERTVTTHTEIAHVVEEEHAPVAVGTMRLAQQGSDQRVAAARLVHYGGAIRIELLVKALDALRQRADAQVRAPVDHQPGRLTGGVGVDDLDRLDLSFPSPRHVSPHAGRAARARSTRSITVARRSPASGSRGGRTRSEPRPLTASARWRGRP